MAVNAGIYQDGTATVVTHTTAVPLKSTKTLCYWATIYPFSTNAGTVRVANANHATITTDVGAPLVVGDSHVLWPVPGGLYDLNLIRVDSDNDNDGVKFVYAAL